MFQLDKPKQTFPFEVLTGITRMFYIMFQTSLYFSSEDITYDMWGVKERKRKWSKPFLLVRLS